MRISDWSSDVCSSDLVLRTMAGPEIGVASTKAFTTQLTLLACFAIACARARGTIDHAREAALSLALTEVPGRAAEVLNHDERIREIAHMVAAARDVPYTGRGTEFPLALEGALKQLGRAACRERGCKYGEKLGGA